MESYIELIEKEEINPALAIFKFKFNNPINFKPGQYITIISNIDSNRILRPYSISSAPYQLPEIEFFIRKVKNGEKLNGNCHLAPHHPGLGLAPPHRTAETCGGVF